MHEYTNISLAISQYLLKCETVDTGELIKKGIQIWNGKFNYKSSLNETYSSWPNAALTFALH